MPGRKLSENTLSLFILAALVILSTLFYIFTVQPYNLDSHHAILNKDTLLYTQYARSIAEGHPYQFNEGDPPTTGSTSHLYIWILAFLYKSGLQQFSLIDGMFVLNILLLLGSVTLFWYLIKRLEPALKWPVTLLVVFNGHLYYGFLGLSDMGLFFFLLFATWCSAVYRKRRWQALALFLLALTRPEGMVIAVLYAFLLIVEKLFKYQNDEYGKRWLVCVAGLLGVLLVLLVNYSLTRMFVFDSTSGKGYFYSHDLLTALMLWGSDVITIIRQGFFNITSNFRQYFYITVLSGLLVVWGLCQRPWGKQILSKREQIENWWLLGIAAQVAIVAMSGWQMIHMDRYFLWVLPILYFYLARGIKALPLRKQAKTVLFAAFILFQGIAYPYYLQAYKKATAVTTTKIKEYVKCMNVLPKNASLGLLGGSGVKYFSSDIRVINFGGVTAPYFRRMYSTVSRLKELQYNENIQFDYFLSDDSSHVFPKALVSDAYKLDVPTIFNSRLYLFPMKWEPLTDMNYPVSLPDTIVSRSCLDTLDVGYLKDENRCAYRIKSIHNVTRILPFAFTFQKDTLNYVDAARPVIGSDYFTLRTRPGQKHWLVMRTVNSDTVKYQAFGQHYNVGTDTKSVRQLVLKSATGFEKILQLERNDNTFGNMTEHVFEIPARAIDDQKTRFAIHGDHLPAHYWMYTE